MALNKSKCVCVTMNTRSKVKFVDGTVMREVDEAKYLGSVITKESSRFAELNDKLRKAMVTAIRLERFWKKSNASVGWKLLVFNAVVVSQLLYGLTSIHLTPTCYRRLDAFQTRCVRMILGIDHAWISRVSNKE
eukprot:9324026-Alexandrium_andersonii.AAC.1